MMIFENPANGHRETVESPRLWCFLFGWLYLATKGAYLWALLYLLLIIPTLGISIFVIPFKAPKIIRNAYMRKGWKDVTHEISRGIQ